MSSRPVPASSLDDLLAHREWIKRLALRLARDEHAAEDLVQDAWLAALRHPPRDEGVRAWFDRVVRNRAQNVRRSETRRDARELKRGPPPPTRSTAESVAEADAHRHVVDAVMALDEPYRTALVLRYFEQVSVREVARRTGAPLETARARLRRGRERLGERLDREFGSRAAWCVPLLDRWPGLTEGATGASTVGSVAATLLGGLIVTKMLIGAVAAVALVSAGLWLSRAGDPVAPPPPPDEGVAVAGDSHGGAREHVTVENSSEPPPPARAGVEVAAAEDDRVDAVRKMIDALPHRKITGVVSDMHGRPLAGATVMGGNEGGPGVVTLTAATAEAQSGDAQSGEGLSATDDNDVAARAIARMIAERYTVRTNVDGTFAMDVPIREHMPAAGGETFVWAFAADHAGAGSPVPDEVDHIELRLHSAVGLRVRLLDRSGTPIAGRTINVTTEFTSGIGTVTTPTDAAGWAVAAGLPAGTVAKVRTKSTARMADLRAIVLLPDHGEAEVVLRDDGVRRIRISAVVSDPAIPVSGFYVRSDDGRSEIRAWPGGREAIVEVPDRGVLLALSTAVGPSAFVGLADGADEVDLRLDVPPHRWIDVAIGDRDPMYMSFAGTVGGQLALASNLTALTTNGVLRLPIVEGGEYSLDEMRDNRHRLIGSIGPERIDLDAAQHVVTVRVVPAAGGALPTGTQVTATTVARGVRNANAGVTATVTGNGDVPLALVPGITYALVVSAPEMASVRVEHRAGAAGGEVPVTLAAGEPLRVAIDGLAGGSRTNVVTFPDFGRVDSKVERGAVVIDGVRDGWLLAMAASRVFLVNADGAVPRDVPVGATFAPVAAGAAARGGKMFLIGTTPLSDGVYPVGLVGAPLGIPEGNYVPVEWRRDEVVVHAAVDLSDSAPTWTCPADDDVEWTRGEHTENALAHVVISAEGARLPVGTLGPGKVTKWRTAGPDVVIELVD